MANHKKNQDTGNNNQGNNRTNERPDLRLDAFKVNGLSLEKGEMTKEGKVIAIYVPLVKVIFLKKDGKNKSKEIITSRSIMHITEKLGGKTNGKIAKSKTAPKEVKVEDL